MPYQDYQKAQKLGEKCYRQALARGTYPYLPALEELLPTQEEDGRVPMGQIEIPIAMIAGTVTAERTNAFASNFMPLLEIDTEFSAKWIALCDDVHENGVKEPITVLEYMQRFYVIEGNKRVSVSAYFGAVSIEANVTRILPKRTESTENIVYYELVDFYRIAGIYEIQMSQVGGFPRLCEAVMPKEEEEAEYQPWDDDIRKDVRFLYAIFAEHYCARNGQRLSVYIGDAFLVFMEIYGFEALRTLSSSELKRRIDRIWSEFQMFKEDYHTSHILSPTEGSRKVALTKILPLSSTPLKIAFLYPKDPQISSWSYNHEIGRRYIQDVFGERIETVPLIATAEAAEAVIQAAVTDGCKVIFTTAPEYHAVSMRMTLAYPEVIFINCSMNTSYRQLRTYYLRIYEAKFLAGIIAGAMTESERVGYIADYPVLGTPASVNAFALGVQMVNPRARVYLDWSSLQDHDPYAYFREKGIDLISNRDINAPLADDTDFGLYGLYGDISFRLAAPVWNWGRLYEELVRSILIGAWKNDANDLGAHALMYYWGISAEAIDIVCSTHLPAGTKRLVQQMRDDIAANRFHLFMGKLYTQDGSCIAEENRQLMPHEIIGADWLLDNVIGRLPEADELKEEYHVFVRDHGLHTN